MSINGHNLAETPARVTGSIATAVLAEVDIVAELAVRPSRLPNYEREHHAFALLTAELSQNPRNMLQKLAEVAVELCDAHTAGISLLEGDVFRWEAVAGVFAAARGGTMPRSESPCGVCIDRGATQLMRFADRCFPALTANPRFVEALLIPFYDHGIAVGTVWIVSHTPERTFDREDERIVRSLSGFASVGWQLWQASEVMTALNRRKGTFLATLGHELRSPLAAIQTAASMMRSTSDHPRAAPAIAIIDRQTHHISRLLDDLLDVARIDSGKLQLERQTVDMRAVVAETVASRRLQLESRHQAISLDLGNEPLIIEADPVRLAQVISNLVDNAAKYTPARGMVSVTATQEEDHVIVAVRDTGVGLAADQVDSIFEPFTQLKGSSGSSAGGLGLGLALVRSLTELHGGTVNVESAGPSQGSTFTVRWPNVRTAEARNRRGAHGRLSNVRVDMSALTPKGAVDSPRAL